MEVKGALPLRRRTVANAQASLWVVRYIINWSNWRAAAGSIELRYGTMGAAELWEWQGCGRGRAGGRQGRGDGGRGVRVAEVQAVEVQAWPRWETGCMDGLDASVGLVKQWGPC